MSDAMLNRDILVDQRYFHLVLLRETRMYPLPDYWAHVGNTSRVLEESHAKQTSVILEHRRLESSVLYSRGSLVSSLSASNDGRPPYHYDLFAMKYSVQTTTYLAFLYPFAALGRDLLNRLAAQHGLRDRCDFQKANLRSIVEAGEYVEQRGEWSATIVGLEVMDWGDTSLKSLRIEGEKPLESALYKHYLSGPIHDNKSILQHCSLRFEVFQPTDLLTAAFAKQRAARAVIHINKFGALKFYLHLNGQNLITIPYLVQRLHELDCLLRAPENPLNRAGEQEE